MSLLVGGRIGPYEITALIGEGGMGQVYRARDTRLHRDVALKVLPPAFTRDADRLARFRREAQVLASLNHPHIAAIHGIEETDGITALVLEFVDGETLADRVARGAIPVDEALPIAKQIAEALEAAHEQGIVHRDLKPANIKLRPDGTVKVLDFGLAKAIEGEAALASVPLDSVSPTITSPAITRIGVILGTAAYMSPEQARGKAIDRRTDIWAFGCVLYEILTGRRPFEGDEVSDFIASVLTKEPDLTAIRPGAPARLLDLLRRCLKKDLRERLRDIGDAGLAIDDILMAPQQVGSAVNRRTRLSAAAWGAILATACVITASVTIVVTRPRTTAADRDRPLLQFSATLPDAHPILPALASSGSLSLAISPDGSQLAYVGMDGQTTRLFLRRLGQLDFTPLPATEGAINPVFSPDGKWLAFVAQRQLKKIPLQGGSPVVLAADIAPGGAAGGSWTRDDTIEFQRGYTLGLWSVPTSPGPLRPLVVPNFNKGENALLWPQLLPQARALLFTLVPDSIASFDDAQIVIESLDDSHARVSLVAGTGGRYLPTGHIVFGNRGNLMVAPFDLSRRQLKGTAVPVVSGVRVEPGTGAVQAAIAADAGTLAYVPAEMSPEPSQLVLVNRKGEVTPFRDVETFLPQDLSVSPDGQRVAVRLVKPNDDIHLYDFERKTFSRLTFDRGDEQSPVWTPDGRSLAYSSQHGRAATILLKVLDSSAPAEPLVKSDQPQYASSFSPDGQLLAYSEVHERTGFDIAVVPLNGDRVPRGFARTEFQERRPAFSPDGGWIAYESNESGDFQVYVARYPDGSAKRQLSIDGGTEPLWNVRRDGTTELLYRNDNKLMAAPVTTGQILRIGTPRMLFEKRFLFPTIWAARSYAPMPGGEQFVFETGGSEAPAREIRVLLNWLDELKRRVPLN